MAQKAEHAVDLASGAVVAVTLQGAHLGDADNVQIANQTTANDRAGSSGI